MPWLIHLHENCIAPARRPRTSRLGPGSSPARWWRAGLPASCSAPRSRPRRRAGPRSSSGRRCSSTAARAESSRARASASARTPSSGWAGVVWSRLWPGRSRPLLPAGAAISRHVKQTTGEALDCMFLVPAGRRTTKCPSVFGILVRLERDGGRLFHAFCRVLAFFRRWLVTFVRCRARSTYMNVDIIIQSVCSRLLGCLCKFNRVPMASRIWLWGVICLWGWKKKMTERDVNCTKMV